MGFKTSETWPTPWPPFYKVQYFYHYFYHLFYQYLIIVIKYCHIIHKFVSLQSVCLYNPPVFTVCLSLQSVCLYSLSVFTVCLSLQSVCPYNPPICLSVPFFLTLMNLTSPHLPHVEEI